MAKNPAFGWPLPFATTSALHIGSPRLAATPGDLVERLTQEIGPGVHATCQRAVPDRPSGDGDPEQDVGDAVDPVDLERLRHPLPPGRRLRSSRTNVVRCPSGVTAGATAVRAFALR